MLTKDYYTKPVNAHLLLLSIGNFDPEANHI